MNKAKIPAVGQDARTVQLLEAIHKAQSSYITQGDPQQVFSELLAVLVALTDSEYGFLDEALRDEQGNWYKVSLALSDISWDAESKRLYQQLASRNMEFRNLDNLAGQPVLTANLVIANDPDHDPRSGGRPPGHPPMRSYMGIPMFFGGELVGAAGVANRPGGYDESIAQFLAPFVATCAAIIHAYRQHRKEQQSQEIIVQSERLLSSMLNAITESALLLSQDGTVQTINITGAQRIGKKPEEVIGHSIYGFIPAENAAYRKEKVAAVCRLGIPIHFEDVRLDRVIHHSLYPVKDGQDHVVRIAVFGQDITDQRRKEETEHFLVRVLECINAPATTHEMLQKIVALIQDFTKCAAVGIRLLDKDGNIPYEAYTGFSGEFYDKESPLSIHSDKCMCINVIRASTDPNLSFYTHGGSFYMNGTTRFLATVSEDDKGSSRNECNRSGYESVALSPIRLGSQVIGMIHIADPRENRTPLQIVEAMEKVGLQLGTGIARTQAEMALLESEKRLKLMAQASNTGLWDWDIASNTVYYSPEWKAQLGYAEEEVPNTFDQWQSRLHPQDCERALAAVNAAIDNSPADFEQEFRLRHKDGSYRWILARAAVLTNAQGNACRMLGSHIDITERKRFQERAQAQQNKLIQASKMATVGLLAAGVAHEINNPNFLLMLNIALVRDAWQNVTPILDRYCQENGDFTVAGRPYEEMKDEMTTIFSDMLEGAQKIKTIVQELAEYSRNAPAAFTEQVDVNACVQSALALLTNKIKKSTEQFSAVYATDLPPIRGNEPRLRQAILHLVLNACEAVPERTRAICVSTRNDETAHAAIIEVCDEGEGMPDGIFEHLTDPFFTTKRDSGGKGLGLAVAEAIVHEHGGRLEFVTALGKGTTARVIIPFSPDA